MSYNIRACLGIDRTRSIDRIAAIIAELQPSVIALQEVDNGRRRSDGLDQALEIARRTSMHAIFCPSFIDSAAGEYGNALLSRSPVTLIRHWPLPSVEGSEPRSAMCIRVREQGESYDVINTHLSFRRVDRRRQFEELAAAIRRHQKTHGRNVILCGDLNCSPREPGYRALLDVLCDAQRMTPGRPLATWPTRWPIRRLDYILAPPELPVERALTARTPTTRIASDHYPLVVDLSTEPASASAELE